KFELVGKGTYSSTNERIQNAIFGIDRSTPMELFEARNAVRIAHIAAGDKYATSILSKADQQLAQAEQTYRGKQGKTAIDSAARETAQTAEEARIMAVKQKLSRLRPRPWRNSRRWQSRLLQLKRRLRNPSRCGRKPTNCANRLKHSGSRRKKKSRSCAQDCYSSSTRSCPHEIRRAA